MILMLQFPIVSPGVDVRVPRAAHTVDKPDPATYEVTVVAIAADRRIFLNSVPVWEEDLAAKVTESLQSKKDKTVLFKGDEDVPYSVVVAAIESLRRARITNISLVVREERAPSGKEDSIYSRPHPGTEP
jgi:biopolymer transport protein ExbD